jgi:hypothetical protein
MTTPTAMPERHSRTKAKSVLPARQWPIVEATAAGRIAASEVAIAMCAAHWPKPTRWKAELCHKNDHDAAADADQTSK